MKERKTKNCITSPAVHDIYVSCISYDEVCYVIESADSLIKCGVTVKEKVGVVLLGRPESSKFVIGES